MSLVAGSLTIIDPAIATAADTTQTCASFGQAGDDLSGSTDGEYTPVVGDPATVVVSNTNVTPESVVLTPDGGKSQSATLWSSVYRGSHTFHLPSPGSTQTPYEHGFSIKVNGIPLGEDGTSAQLLGFVKSRLCTYQRNLTAAQVAGTGSVTAGGQGSLSFNIHLSAEAPPVNERNSDQFVVTATQQAPGGNADLAHPIIGTVTFPPGAQDATLTVPIAAEPAGTPPVSITFLLTGNAKHLLDPVLVTGTVTTT